MFDDPGCQIFIFPMENPPFGESIVNIFIFWGPLKQIKVMV
jgi:hypothetical protein